MSQNDRPAEMHSSDDAGDMDDLILGLSELEDNDGLEELSQAYAQLLAEQELLNAGITTGLKPLGTEADTPAAGWAAGSSPASAQIPAPKSSEASNPDTYVDLRRLVEAARTGESEDRVAVTPMRIVEALLFVGAADNSPLSGRLIASLMRGVSPEEVDTLVDDLNKNYESDGSAYRITREALGFRMELASTHANLRQRFYGQIREAKLPQPVIDVLALVAYHQPVARKQVEKLIGNACGSALNQLLRRNLIQLAKEPDVGPVYRTTPRFLELFDLGSLEDLPQSESMDSNS
jgi:segregation and condensation protein B